MGIKRLKGSFFTFSPNPSSCGNIGSLFYQGFGIDWLYNVKHHETTFDVKFYINKTWLNWTSLWPIYRGRKSQHVPGFTPCSVFSQYRVIFNAFCCILSFLSLLPTMCAPLDLQRILQLSTLKRKVFKHFVQDHPHPPTIYHKLDSEVLVNSRIWKLGS